jgi:rsbT co-antagonist protein RsbR
VEIGRVAAEEGERRERERAEELARVNALAEQLAAERAETNAQLETALADLARANKALREQADEAEKGERKAKGDASAARGEASAARNEVEELRRANEELRQAQTTIATQQQAISAQRAVIAEMSTPILAVANGTLVLPIQGTVDTRRAADMMEALLGRITSARARFAIVDVTGVSAMDTHTAGHLIKMVRAAELIGSRCVVTGVRPDVAQTLVEEGIDMTGLETLHSLQDGIEWCRAQSGRTR